MGLEGGNVGFWMLVLALWLPIAGASMAVALEDSGEQSQPSSYFFKE